MNIPKGTKKKAACAHSPFHCFAGCPKKNSTSCEDCPAKIAYDIADELAEKQYYKEYRAICDNCREKVNRAINRQRKERTRRKRW